MIELAPTQFLAAVPLFERTRFGVLAAGTLEGGHPGCKSVFTGAGEVEISISTAPGYRRKGLARLAGAAFLQACLARGLKPVWPDNEPSVALAHGLGFIDDLDQDVCMFELENQ